MLRTKNASMTKSATGVRKKNARKALVPLSHLRYEAAPPPTKKKSRTKPPPLDAISDAIYQSLKSKALGDGKVTVGSLGTLRGWLNGNWAFIGGAAGTGKTTLIKAIHESFEELGFGKLLMIVATTNLAAKLLPGGRSVHSAFGLAGDSKIEKPYRHPGVPCLMNHRGIVEARKKERRQVRWFIVDEVSMLSPKVFVSLTVLCRAPMLFIGDPAQLPPVKAKPVFMLDTWNAIVTKRHLLTRLRRATDPRFAQLLARMSRNECTDEDIALLQTRVGKQWEPLEGDPCDLDQDLKRFNRVIICPYNRIVDEENNRILGEMKHAEVVALPVEITSIQHNKRELKDDPTVRRVIRKSSAVSKLRTTLPKGCRVMVTRGSKMLCKDECGYLVSRQMVASGRHRQVPVAKVRLVSSPTRLTEIAMVTSSIRVTALHDNEIKTFHVKYKHFPLKVAYAITGHAVQGQTVHEALIHVGVLNPFRDFAVAWLYVAITRLRRLEHAFIKGPLKKGHLRVDAKIVQYLKRMA